MNFLLASKVMVERKMMMNQKLSEKHKNLHFMVYFTDTKKADKHLNKINRLNQKYVELEKDLFTINFLMNV